MCVGAFQRGYVEKNTRGCLVPVADCPKASGAGFAETGRLFANAMSSCSILRCSCGMGRLGCIMRTVCHSTDDLHSWRISNGRLAHSDLSVMACSQQLGWSLFADGTL